MLFTVLCVVYFTFMKFLQADFFERLTDRTMVTATLYLEADEISREALDVVRQKYLQKLSDEVIRIYDEKDRASFIGDAAQYWTKSTIEKVRRKKYLQYKDGEKQVVGIYYKDNQGDFVILASATDFGSHNRLNKLLKIMVFAFLVISILILLLSRWVAENMLAPLHSFAHEVKQVGFQNMSFRVEERESKDEISLITKSFNHLMEDLEQAFVLQKTFIANASHELRTPVTRMMMTAELSLSKDRDKQSYQRALRSLLEDAEKMDGIISGLLALAKIDLELAHSQLSLIRIDDLLKKISRENKAQTENNLRLIIRLPDNAEPKVSANPVLLQIALDNLISNAFKFSHGQEVILELESSGDTYFIHIHDQGIGLDDSTSNELFNPFFSRSEDVGEKGEGMGLYITKKIIDLHKGLVFTTKRENGTTFSVSLAKL